MERVINVVKVIGKCGLSYRGHIQETAYTLENIASNHGNFLELILLLSKYDVCLQEHVSDCIEKSKKQMGSKGRGSLVTMMSKTTVNKVIEVIRSLIQQTIAAEVKKAGMFSVQLDTTQDLTSKDQCAVVLRYVTTVVHERLIAVIDCESSTGQYFVDLVKETLAKMDIDIKHCIGNATDEAANMQGQYRGFTALLTEVSPNQVHIWCYSHILNRVLSDTTWVVVASESLFCLLNNIAVLIRDSYKRMHIWEETTEDKRHRRLGVIGETRWWAKDEALKKVFGGFAKPDQALYTDVIITMEKTEKDMTIKPAIRSKAQGYKDALLRYETILTAEIYLRIFENTSPLSKYLQTSGIDFVTAQHLVTGTEDNLRKYARDFESVKKAADNFVEWTNGILEEQQNCDAEAQTALPEKRTKKKKRRPGELAEDEDYEIKIHNVILDTVAESIHHRYAANAVLCADVSCMDPKRFPEIREKGLPNTAMKELSKCLLKFDDRATVEALQAELTSLAQHWEGLKQSLQEEYNTRAATTSDDSGEDLDESVELFNL